MKKSEAEELRLAQFNSSNGSFTCIQMYNNGTYVPNIGKLRELVQV